MPRPDITRLLITILGFCAAAGAAVASDVAIDLGPARQQIKGWGMYAQPGIETQPAAVQRDVYAVGATFVRLALPPDGDNADGSINAPAFDQFIANVKLAKSLGVEKYVISVWSPPAFMKAPEQTTKGVGTDGVTPEYLRPGQEGRFADYLAAACGFLKGKVGLPDAISVENEPDFSPIWDGCNYTLSSDTVATWARVVKATRTALNRAGLSSVAIVGPETAGLSTNSELLQPAFSALATDKELSSALTGFAIHTYGTYEWRDVASSMAAYPRDVWMLEWCAIVPRGTSDLDRTIALARRLNADTVDMGSNYWFWWECWDLRTESDGQELIWTNISTKAVTRTKMHGFLKAVWTNAKPGCYVRPATVSDDAPDESDRLIGTGGSLSYDRVDVAAYQTGKTSTVLVIANGTNTAKTVDTITGVSGTKAEVYQTDSTGGDMALVQTLPITSGAIHALALPTYGVDVIVCR